MTKKEPILVLSKKVFIEKYKEFFDSYNYKNYEVLDWPDELKLEYFLQYCKRRVISHIQNQEYDEYGPIRNKVTFDVDKIFDYIKKELNEHPSGMEKVFEWMSGYNNIFIDDAFDECNLYGKGLMDIHWIVYCCYTIISYNALSTPTNLVWIATDAFEEFRSDSDERYGDDFFKRIQEILRLANTGCYTVTLLRKMMRCPAKIFDNCYFLKTPHQHPSTGFNELVHWCLEMEPSLEHMIQGKTPLVLDAICEMEDEAFHKLWAFLGQELIRLCNQGFESSDVAIIINYGLIFLGCFAVLWDFYDAIEKRCPENYQFLWSKEHTTAHILVHGKFFPVYRWDGVSSLEWPVVIYINLNEFYGDNVKNFIDRRASYRALSRATVESIVIAIAFPSRIRKPTSSLLAITTINNDRGTKVYNNVLAAITLSRDKNYKTKTAGKLVFVN